MTELKTYHPGKTVLQEGKYIVGYNSAIKDGSPKTAFAVVTKEVMADILNDKSRGFSIGVQKATSVEELLKPLKENQGIYDFEVKEAD